MKYQIVTVTGEGGDREGRGTLGKMVDSLEKIVKEEVKKGWEPVGGISWSPVMLIGEDVHVSQVLRNTSS